MYVYIYFITRAQLEIRRKFDVFNYQNIILQKLNY